MSTQIPKPRHRTDNKGRSPGNSYCFVPGLYNLPTCLQFCWAMSSFSCKNICLTVSQEGELHERYCSWVPDLDLGLKASIWAMTSTSSYYDHWVLFFRVLISDDCKWEMGVSHCSREERRRAKSNKRLLAARNTGQHFALSEDGRKLGFARTEWNRRQGRHFTGRWIMMYVLPKRKPSNLESRRPEFSSRRASN